MPTAPGSPCRRPVRDSGPCGGDGVTEVDRRWGPWRFAPGDDCPGRGADRPGPGAAPATARAPRPPSPSPTAPSSRAPDPRRTSRRGPSRSACSACRCSPGGTSRTPRRAARSSTPTTWPPPGPAPASTSSMRTSAVPGKSAHTTRAGYRVIRKSGRYGVFPRSALCGHGGPARPARRPRGDLERHAVLRPGVGALPPDRLPPSRARRDVAAWSSRPASPASARPSSCASPPPSTATAGSSPCRRRRATRSCPCSASIRPGERGPARRRPALRAGRQQVARSRGDGGRAGWCR